MDNFLKVDKLTVNKSLQIPLYKNKITYQNNSIMFDKNNNNIIYKHNNKLYKLQNEEYFNGFISNDTYYKNTDYISFNDFKIEIDNINMNKIIINLNKILDDTEKQLISLYYKEKYKVHIIDSIIILIK